MKKAAEFIGATAVLIGFITVALVTMGLIVSMCVEIIFGTDFSIGQGVALIILVTILKLNIGSDLLSHTKH